MKCLTLGCCGSASERNTTVAGKDARNLYSRTVTFTVSIGTRLEIKNTPAPVSCRDPHSKQLSHSFHSTSFVSFGPFEA